MLNQTVLDIDSKLWTEMSGVLGNRVTTIIKLPYFH